MAGWWSSQNTYAIYQLSLPSYTGKVHSAPKQLQWQHQRSLITIPNIIIMKSLKYCENCQNVTDTQSEQMLWIDLLNEGLPQTSNLEKKKKKQ